VQFISKVVKGEQLASYSEFGTFEELIQFQLYSRIHAITSALILIFKL